MTLSEISLTIQWATRNTAGTSGRMYTYITLLLKLTPKGQTDFHQTLDSNNNNDVSNMRYNLFFE